ncbi:hypothetical protein D3C81_2099750 [compost metagenome]
MGKTLQKCCVIGQPDIAQGIDDALLLRGAVEFNLVNAEGFTQQTADTQSRIQGGHRVLGHVADQATPSPTQVFAPQRQQRLT